MRRVHFFLAALLACVTLATAAHAVEYKQVVVHNTCKYAIKIFVRHLPPPGEWVNTGWWTIQPDQMAPLLDDGEKVLHDMSAPIFYYAEIPRTDYSWTDPKGRTSTRFHGRSYSIQRRDIDVNEPLVKLHCNNKK